MTMTSKPTKSKQVGKTQCPECAKAGRDNHEDNLAIFDDNHRHCFACGYQEQPNTGGESGIDVSREELVDMFGEPTAADEAPPPVQPMPKRSASMDKWRGISPQAFDKYRCYRSGGDIIFPYGDETWKARSIKGKTFWASTGDKEVPLFGMDKFPTGGRFITVTEGELDAIAYYDMTGFPAVSVQGSDAAHGNMKAAYDWLMTFDVIKIVFDADDPGRKAVASLKGMFPPHQIAVVNLTQHKDTNAYLEAGDVKAYTAEWWAAEPKRPTNILSTRADMIRVLEEAPVEPIARYPFPTLDAKLDGMREGELNFWLAHTGQGKTEVMRAIEHSLLETTDFNIGIMHLEEPPKRVIDGLLTYQFERPVHLNAVTGDISTPDKIKAWDSMTGGSDRVHIFKMFGGDDVMATLNLIRYMVVAQKCKVIILDHISMLVSGSTDGDERRILDMLTTQLAILAQELSCVIQAVSHVNDDGKARSSRNAEKVAHNLMFIKRDIEAADENERNTTSVMVRKARYTGDTGPAGFLFFDKQTYMLAEKEREEEAPKATDYGMNREEESDDNDTDTT